jgi:hypothetical protein
MENFKRKRLSPKRKLVADRYAVRILAIGCTAHGSDEPRQSFHVAVHA